MTSCSLVNLEIRTLKPNRLKCQTSVSDAFKLLCHNSKHQQEFIKQKIAALHHCDFNFKFSKHCYFNHYFG